MPVQRVAVYWDASFRRQQQDKARDIAVLVLFASMLAEATEGAAQLDVHLLRHALEPAVSFSCKDGEGLKVFLEKVVYDGTKRLDALQPPSSTSDFCVLFSDGIVALGKNVPTQIKAFPPIYSVSGSVQAVNHNALRALSSLTGGAYLALGKMAENEKVVAALGRPAFSLVGIDAAEGAIVEAHPQGIVPLQSKVRPIADYLVYSDFSQGNSLTVTGKLGPKVRQAAVTLHYGFDSTTICSSFFALTFVLLLS